MRPWQNPYVERVIGSLRRECLDHVIVLNERSLQRHLQRYIAYYHDWRTHLSLDKDAPVAASLPNRQPAARSSPFHTSAVCITTTNVAPPEPLSTPSHFRRTRPSSGPSCTARHLQSSADISTSRSRFRSRVLATFNRHHRGSTGCGWSFW